MRFLRLFAYFAPLQLGDVLNDRCHFQQMMDMTGKTPGPKEVDSIAHRIHGTNGIFTYIDPIKINEM